MARIALVLLTDAARSLTRFAGVLGLAALLSGCSITAGGWSLCLLDHTNLQLSVQHEHADPNAN